MYTYGWNKYLSRLHIYKHPSEASLQLSDLPMYKTSKKNSNFIVRTLGYRKSNTKHKWKNAASPTTMSILPKSLMFSIHSSKTNVLNERSNCSFIINKYNFTYLSTNTARKCGLTSSSIISSPLTHDIPSGIRISCLFVPWSKCSQASL